MVQDSQVHYANRGHGVKLQYFLVQLLSALMNGSGRMRIVRMLARFLIGTALGLAVQVGLAAGFQPASQQFRQEIARRFRAKDGAPEGPVALLDCIAGGTVRVFAGGQWYEFRDGHWEVNAALKAVKDTQFVFADSKGRPTYAPLPWREVRQFLRAGATNLVAGSHACIAFPGQSYV